MVNSPQLKDGSEWAEYEDCIVGNEPGLRNLISACEIALEKGEYHGKDLGDYMGVKKLETIWFESPQRVTSARVTNSMMAIVLVGFVVLMIIGGYTVCKWIF